MYRQKLYVCFSLLLFLCVAFTPIHGASAKSQKPIYQIITELQDNLTTKNWDAADQYAQKLKRYYHKHLWKYQLMGDEAEYESVANAISQVQAAIAVKDNKQALLILTDLKATLKQIYSL
ncbi:hypothetical protein GCM10011391_17400 [Pullulanibacillus camelliae]|uniref:DUF4363 family protein n=1 Tax=Pullulanibacillus camelliae TaxID=1707096 RepID=A0A8J2VMS7_9BACL|nr:DUF4363 family protein [Pullulanibacillus camelliae]GGE39118.1 hypothetical protein GCM10011391_17400 [Pullulanibacillus camelliae]